MAEPIDQLIIRRDAVLAEIAAISTSAAGGKPNSRDGGIDHLGYKQGLYAELREINEQIAIAEGPWEEVLIGRPG